MCLDNISHAPSIGAIAQTVFQIHFAQNDLYWVTEGLGDLTLIGALVRGASVLNSWSTKTVFF